MSVFCSVKQVIHETFGIPIEELEANRTFRELQLCPLDITELVMALEDEFDIIIAGEDEEKLNSVDDLVKIISAA